MQSQESSEEHQESASPTSQKEQNEAQRHQEVLIRNMVKYLVEEAQNYSNSVNGAMPAIVVLERMAKALQRIDRISIFNAYLEGLSVKKGVETRLPANKETIELVQKKILELIQLAPNARQEKIQEIVNMSYQK
jgi:hypothetical protein